MLSENELQSKIETFLERKAAQLEARRHAKHLRIVSQSHTSKHVPVLLATHTVGPQD